MKNRWIVLVLVLLLLPLGMAASAQPRDEGLDEVFGMALVDLCEGREEEALKRLGRACSPSGRALRAALKGEQVSVEAFDVKSPVWHAFRAYVVCAAKRREYAFLRKVISAADKAAPSKDLGRLGLYMGARFSPQGHLLVLRGSRAVVVLESATGKLVERLEVGDQDDLWRFELVYGPKEKRRLVHRAFSGREDENAKLELQDVATGKTLWSRTWPGRIEAGFARDREVVLVLSYEAGVERTDVTIEELGADQGKTLSRKARKGVSREELDALAAASFQPPPPMSDSEAADVALANPSGKGKLTGSVTSGTFRLRDGKGKVLRTIRFASGVE